MNLYGFAGGDPVNFSDPFGLCGEPNDDNGVAGGDTTKKKRPAPVSCEYSQSTGSLSCQDAAGNKFNAKGYSGAPGHVNKPEDQKMPNKDPIPQGAYRIELPFPACTTECQT